MLDRVEDRLYRDIISYIFYLIDLPKLAFDSLA